MSSYLELDTPAPRPRSPLAWWRRSPARIRLASVAAVIAVAGLIWQHHPQPVSPTPGASRPAVTSTPAPPPPAPSAAGDSRVGEIDPAALTPDMSGDAAQATAQRFATNFANPGTGFDDWFARISPDVSAQLQEQYRLTDVRNLTSAAVESVSGPLNELPGTMAFRVDYSDGSSIEVRVESGLEGWKVINVLPVARTDPAQPDPSTVGNS